MFVVKINKQNKLGFRERGFEAVDRRGPSTQNHTHCIYTAIVLLSSVFSPIGMHGGEEGGRDDKGHTFAHTYTRTHTWTHVHKPLYSWTHGWKRGEDLIGKSAFDYMT